MGKIVHYEIFKSNREFIEYQKVNDIEIISVTPFTASLKTEGVIPKKWKAVEVGVFVVFYCKQEARDK